MSDLTDGAPAPTKYVVTCLTCGRCIQQACHNERFCDDVHRDQWWASRRILASFDEALDLARRLEDR